MSVVGSVAVRVVPSMRGFGPTLAREGGPAVTKQGLLLGAGLGKSMAKGLAIGGAALTAAVAGFAGYGLKEFAKFEKGMNEVFTLLPGISEQAMQQMSDDVREFSREMGIAHDQAVPALYSAISAGIPRENVFDFMEVAAQAAVGGVTDMETAVDGLTSVMNAYGQENMSAQEASDLMFTAVRLGKTNFEELSGSLYNVLPTASALGVEFGDVTAAMASMTAQGTPTSVATTQLRQMMVELSKDGGAVSEVFQEVAGKSFKEFVAEGGNTQEALALLHQHAQDTGVGINDLFGSVEAGNAALALSGDNASGYADNIAEMADSAGATADAYDGMDEGIARAMERIGILLKDASLELADNIAPAFHRFADFLQDNLPKAVDFASGLFESLGDILGEIAEGVGAFRDAWNDADGDVTRSGFPGFMERVAFHARSAWERLLDFGGWLSDNRGTILGFASTLGGLVLGIYAARTAIAIVRTAKALWAAQNAILLLSTIALSGGIRGIGLAIRSIPVIGWIITLIGALGGFFAWFFTQTETGQRWWETAWDAIKTATAFVVDWFMETALPILQRVWDGIMIGLNWLNDHVIQPVWSAIKFGFSILVSAIKWYWENVLQPTFSVIATVAVWLWENVIKPAWGHIQTAWGILVDYISWYWENVLKPTWDTIATVAVWLWENVLRPAFHHIRDAWGRMVDRIKWYWDNILSPVITLVADIIMWLWNNVAKPYFRNIWEGFKVMAGWVSHHWRETIKPALDRFMEVVGVLWKSHIKPTLEWISDKWDWVSGKIKGFWEDTIKPALSEFKDFIVDEVVPRVEQGVDMIRSAWEKVANFFRTPINWVIRTVWNGGIVKAFNAVANAVDSEARLGEISEIGKFGRSDSSSGAHDTGPMLQRRFAVGGAVIGAGTGTSDDILARLSNGEHVLTADEVKRLGGQDAVYDLRRRIRRGDDVQPEVSERLAGSSPSEALLPMGGPLDGLLSAWRSVSSVVDLVRGNFVDWARSLAMPLVESLTGKLGGFGLLGELGGDWMAHMVGSVFDWAKGEDDKAGEFGSFDGAFTGPTGDWRRPSKGPITSWYGPRWGTIHSGIDIAGGGPTYAAYNGVVSRTGWNIVPGRTGIGILLNHGGGMHTYYGHNPVGGVRVSPGDQVSAGQHIGAQGATGNVTGTHLHWELHRGGVGRAVNVNSMFRDKGGLIYPGMNLVRNETGGAEYVFNQSQFDNLNRIAERGGSAGPGLTVNQYGMDYRDSRGVVSEFAKATRRAERGGAHAVPHS
ncbi:phage tail tape measure protein [Nesterenkonia suensis]